MPDMLLIIDLRQIFPCRKRFPASGKNRSDWIFIGLRISSFVQDFSGLIAAVNTRKRHGIQAKQAYNTTILIERRS